MEFEAFERLLAGQRAVRRFDTARPVDDALVERALRLATFAPNGGNQQPWRFIVVRDAAVKARLSAVYDTLVDRQFGNAQNRTPWTQVPVLVAVCSVPRPDGRSADTSPPAASIFPAVQNLLLALQALGLAGVLTTAWKQQEDEMRAVLGLPPEANLHAILPIGWPDRRYGRNRRKPVAEVAFRERFGRPWDA